MFAGNLSSALFPALSHMRTDPRAQSEAAFKAAKFMSLVIMPLAFLQAAVIEPAIYVLFRDKWDAAIPLMQILSVALGFDAVAWVAGTLQVAKRGFWKQLVYLSLFSRHSSCVSPQAVSTARRWAWPSVSPRNIFCNSGVQLRYFPLTRNGRGPPRPDLSHARRIGPYRHGRSYGDISPHHSG